MNIVYNNDSLKLEQVGKLLRVSRFIDNEWKMIYTMVHPTKAKIEFLINEERRIDS